MTTATINTTAVETAKSEFKASLEKQVAPINTRIAELKSEIASLQSQKAQVETMIKNLDRKPAAGRVWSEEAKKKLSIALKASAARKKAEREAAQATPVPRGTEPPAPVVDTKSRAANDDSAVAAPATKKRTGTR